MINVHLACVQVCVVKWSFPHIVMYKT